MSDLSEEPKAGTSKDFGSPPPPSSPQPPPPSTALPPPVAQPPKRKGRPPKKKEETESKPPDKEENNADSSAQALPEGLMEAVTEAAVAAVNAAAAAAASDSLIPSETSSATAKRKVSAISTTSEDQDGEQEDEEQLPPADDEEVEHENGETPIVSEVMRPPVTPASSSTTSDPNIPPPHVGRRPLSGQACTLRTLLDDGIVLAGSKVLIIDQPDYQATGDLLPNGNILWVEKDGQLFQTPSGWMNAVRRSFDKAPTPDSRPISAWSIIKYEGKRLDSYKLRWYRRQKKAMGLDTNSPGMASMMNNSNSGSNKKGPNSSMGSSNQSLLASSNVTNSLGPPLVPTFGNGMDGGDLPNSSMSHLLPGLPIPLGTPITGATLAAMSTSQLMQATNLMNPYSFSVKKSELMSIETAATREFLSRDLKRCGTEKNVLDHNVLFNKQSGNQNMYVMCRATPFSLLDRLQPFTVTVSSNALLLIDFHAHLTKGEVLGYLAGSWDLQSHNLAILQAFPCRSRLGDPESASLVEEEIRQAIERRNLTVVGWYHSHPSSAAQPTVKDIESQMEYQISMKGEMDSQYIPCVGLISSPYDHLDLMDLPPSIAAQISSESAFQSSSNIFWVMPPPEYKPFEYGKPMQMIYSIARDSFLTQDLLLEMRLLAHFYAGAPDLVDFTSPYPPIVEGRTPSTIYPPGSTYWNKLQVSLRDKLPRDLQDVPDSGSEQAQVQQQALEHFWAFIKGLITRGGDNEDGDDEEVPDEEGVLLDRQSSSSQLEQQQNGHHHNAANGGQSAAEDGEDSAEQEEGDSSQQDESMATDE